MGTDDVGELIALFNARFDSLSQQLEEYLLLMGGRVDHLEKETDRRFQRAFASYQAGQREGSHAGISAD